MIVPETRPNFAASYADAAPSALSQSRKDVSVVVGTSVAARITVEFAVVDGISTVAFVGEIDVLSARAFAVALGEVLDKADDSAVADLTGISFLGAAGVEALARFLGDARAAKVECFVACGRSLARLLHRVGVDIGVCPSRQDAISQAVSGVD